MKEKQKALDLLLEAINATGRNEGEGRIIELRLINDDRGRFVRPIFSHNPETTSRYHDINVTADSGPAMLKDTLNAICRNGWL